MERSDEPLFKRIHQMSVPEKMRLAYSGDKDARALLILDPVKEVQLAVINNPRITDSEIVAISRFRSVHEDVLRRIASNREWLKLYPVRLALAQDPKTPLSISLRIVPTLMRRDLRLLAKSKSVPEVIAHAAKRQLMKKG